MNEQVGGAQARSIADAVARRSYGKLVAFLAARTRDVDAAEDALAEAFASALADWPRNGCPANPEAWLLTVARRKFLDAVRNNRRTEPASDELERMAEGLVAATDEEELPDQRLGLMFACAHPAIDAGVRAPLMLQAVLGLDAAKISSAFLVSPATMGQRLVRAKQKIRQAGIPLRIPEREELHDRLETVLDAIYAAFTEGWIDASGTDAARRELAEEAIYLCRLVTELLPHEPEAMGLLALMLYAESRQRARRDAQGEYVPMAEQRMEDWNAAMIDEAESLILRASRLAVFGRYQLEGAIQSAHVARRRTGIANWNEVLQLYDALLQYAYSPVVVINRALALAELEGAQAGLDAIEALSGDARLADYQPWWAARAELLARTGRREAAQHAYDIAIGLERDEPVRRFLDRRRSAVVS
jgi:RNA polymerase sigma-70 factor (ECF subfamily)